MLIPTGLTSNTATPQFVGQLRYAQGLGGTVGEQVVLLAGHKLPSGVTAADYELFDVVNPVTAADYVGRGSELGRMIRAAATIPGVKLKCLAIPEPSAGTAATATITFTGTATSPGSVDLYFGSDVCSVNIAKDDTPTVQATNAVTVLNAIPYIYFTATNSSGVVTLTMKTKGIRGNDHIIFIDTSRIAGGVTCAVTGGTARANGGVPFGTVAGAGADTDATYLAVVRNVSIQYSAWAPNSTTNAAAIKAQAETKANPFDVGPENTILANTTTDTDTADDLTAVFSQFFGQVLWAANHRNHPSEIAAVVAAYRSVVEAAPVTVLGDPNHRYLNEPLPFLAPHWKADVYNPSTTITEAAYAKGLTPLVTINGKLCIQRSVTSYWTDGTNPDYRVRDTADSLVPQRVLSDIRAIWLREFSVENPYVGPDLPDGEAPPAQRATPSGWAARINSRMKLDYAPKNLVLLTHPRTGVALAATSEYNADLGCLVTDVPVCVTPKQFITAVVVNQIAR